MVLALETCYENEKTINDLDCISGMHIARL